jgi:two-component system, chemotaxis family, CheB/CheR fusion protein
MAEPLRAPSDGHLVVVGSSAGGVEALSVLVGGLKTAFPAPVVLAQHLDPARPSHLGAILERRSKLPVVVVEDDTTLEAGKVYVVPSNKHVVIRDGMVGLVGDHADRPRPSVDLLLSSAAKSYGERLVAVILTGQGSDGAAGAVDVKDGGGTVIIQNPHTAAFPSMPLALPPTAVDHVADVESIPALLHDIVSGAILPAPTGEDGAHFTEILALVGRQAGIDFRTYKPTTLLRRIARRMAITHARSLEDYRRQLELHPGEVGDLVMSLLIKVTEFFRDPEAFEFLRREVMPSLIQRGREQGRTLRVWSAGCATGEEAYSLALLLADMIGPDLPEWNVRIFATDLDESAINFARRGLYPENVVRNLPDDFRGRFFEQADQGLRVSKALRQIVIFGHQDISRGVPFPRIDLVVCRNLLIYFKPELQQDVLDLFAYSLSQRSGYLFLGKAETARPTKATFELVNKKWKVYRCLSGPLHAPAGAGSRKGEALAAAPWRAQAGNAALLPMEGRDSEMGQFRRLADVVLRHVPIGLVLVDRDYRILTMNAAGRRLLGIRDLTAAGQDFLHAARGIPYAEVRAGIDRVFRENTVVLMPDLSVEGTTDGRWLGLSAAPLHLEGVPGELALISVVDVTEGVLGRQKLEALRLEQRQLTDELVTSNKRLSEMNKELQDANEELQAANEEMMVAQEELQATNEEFETTNEELQATNEELETNNEELQATNEELETTNEELTARTAELQEMARVLTTERVRLTEIVQHAPLQVLVLRGPTLAVEALNPPSSQLFGGVEVLGRPFEDVAGADVEKLVSAARTAYREDRKTTGETRPGGAGGNGRRFTFSAVPLHDASGAVDGTVLYLEDGE